MQSRLTCLMSFKRSSKHLTLRTMYSQACSSSAINEISAKLIYSLAPAIGHNEKEHPECSSRVPAILSALEKMQLSQKFRGSEIVQLQNLRTATVEDIASVHSRSYISDLEKCAVTMVKRIGFAF